MKLGPKYSFYCHVFLCQRTDSFQELWHRLGFPWFKMDISASSCDTFPFHRIPKWFCWKGPWRSSRSSHECGIQAATNTQKLGGIKAVNVRMWEEVCTQRLLLKLYASCCFEENLEKLLLGAWACIWTGPLFSTALGADLHSVPCHFICKFSLSKIILPLLMHFIQHLKHHLEEALFFLSAPFISCWRFSVQSIHEKALSFLFFFPPPKNSIKALFWWLNFKHLILNSSAYWFFEPCN